MKTTRIDLSKQEFLTERTVWQTLSEEEEISFWKTTSKLIDYYRKHGKEDEAQVVVNCRILYNREKDKSS